MGKLTLALASRAAGAEDHLEGENWFIHSVHPDSLANHQPRCYHCIYVVLGSCWDEKNSVLSSGLYHSTKDVE